MYKILLKIILSLSFLCITTYTYADENKTQAITEEINISELNDYDNYPEAVKNLIAIAANLTKKDLTYKYGSADPVNGGMDCSGTMNYLLKSANVKNVPRQSDEMYKWVWKDGKFHAVNAKNFTSFEFAALKPGDLLFWTGTYAVKRDPAISHVMLYLGKDKQGNHLMFGASDGRTYHNLRMRGVSIFDFKLPNGDSESRFVGYGCIPDLTCE